MHKIVRRAEAQERSVGATKSVLDYVTMEINPAVSLVVVRNKGDWGGSVAKYSRVFFVLEGALTLKFSDEEIILEAEDACFVDKGEAYNFSGDCRVIVVDAPAHGT